MHGRHSAIATITAVLIAGSVSAQIAPHDHGAAPSGSSPSPQTADGQGSKPLTITGCLMRQQDAIPGRGETAGEPAAFVVVAVGTSGHHQGGLGGMRSSPSTAGTASHAHTPPPVGTSGTTDERAVKGQENISESQMFTMAGVASAELTPLAGKRVEVTGRIDTDALRGTHHASNDPASPTITAHAAADPDAAPFLVESIRPIEGSCPGK
jgi:hypothetical protein